MNLCLKLSNLPRLRQVPGGAGTEPEVCPCAAAGGPAGGGGAGGRGGGGGSQAQGLHPHHLQTAVPAVTALADNIYKLWHYKRIKHIEGITDNRKRRPLYFCTFHYSDAFKQIANITSSFSSLR